MKSPKQYWVPEDAMFLNAGDCLDDMPELGAAALVYSQSAYQELKDMCDSFVRELDIHDCPKYLNCRICDKIAKYKAKIGAGE
jgi:hypothetical protein